MEIGLVPGKVFAILNQIILNFKVLERYISHVNVAKVMALVKNEVYNPSKFVYLVV